jgi:arylsulfatase A-like enzyme
MLTLVDLIVSDFISLIPNLPYCFLNYDISILVYSVPIMVQSRPNIIWIFGDQQPAHMLGCNGNADIATPHIDSMAAHGINFTQATAGFPLCCPFRGALLTGLYPHHCVPGHEYPLDPSIPTIAYDFNQAKYHTAYFGKWHLDGFKERDGRAAFHIVPPERRGQFQTWVGYENNNLQWDCWVHGGDIKKDDKPFHYQLPGYETDELATLLIDHLIKFHSATKADPQPFFGVLSVQPPHNPYIAPDEYMNRYFDEDTGEAREINLRPNIPHLDQFRNIIRDEICATYAMIENLDHNVGRIITTLQDLDILEDTYVFFFSDHGDMHGSHGQFRKTTAYEESIRIPFVVRIPAHFAKGENSYGINESILINHVDIAATTLGLCGIPIPPNRGFEGTDYSQFFTSRHSTDLTATHTDSVFLQNIIPTGHSDSIDKPWRGIITKEGWKYVCFEGIEWLLFYLPNDPFEEQNFAHNTLYQQKKYELNCQLQKWLDKTRDSFRLPLITLKK